MALVHAGYGDVSNYYASFGEWSADPTLPIVGPSPTTAPAALPSSGNVEVKPDRREVTSVDLR